jgi:hypothetical protein
MSEKVSPEKQVVGQGPEPERTPVSPETKSLDTKVAASGEAQPRYEAYNVGGTTWMVKRFKADATWDEALLSTESTDAEDVIREAIERRSWA